MLVRHGYGVLVYDPRGSGNSEGTVNSYGWGWEKDAAAALDFLAKRDDVEPGRVGVLGLSTGADIAIDIAPRDDVKAVVADGSAAIGYQDIKEYTDDPLTRAPMWVVFKTLEVIQGRSEPKAALADQIARSHAPSLSSPPASPRRSGASSTTRPAAPAPRSGTSRRPATPPRCGSTRRPTSSASCRSSTGTSRGADQNRTGVNGFAGRCVATPPRRQGRRGYPPPGRTGLGRR